VKEVGAEMIMHGSLIKKKEEGGKIDRRTLGSTSVEPSYYRLCETGNSIKRWGDFLNSGRACKLAEGPVAKNGGGADECKINEQA